VEAVAVEGQGQAVLRGDGGQERGVAVQIFGGAEVEREHGARGVIDGPVQAQARPAVLEPVEGTSIELHEGTHAGSWLAPGPILPRAARALCPPGPRPAPPSGPA